MAKALKISKSGPVPVTSGLDNPILRAVSKLVERPAAKLRDSSVGIIKSSNGPVGAEIFKLLKIMHATMKKEQGIGIAAPQVGVNLRVALAKLNPNTKEEKIITMINPEILERSLRTQADQEGCLSLRGKWRDVERSESLTVIFFDENWVENRLNLSGLNARIIQHEVDHLDGILFWDRVKNQDERGA